MRRMIIMVKYKKLSRKEELAMIEKVNKMVNIGLWADDVAELLDIPIELAEKWVNICKWHAIMNAQKEKESQR
jgi:hypothetical protein